MRSKWVIFACLISVNALISLPAFGNDGVSVIKKVKHASERGRMSDRREFVRGDSGKWNDVATLQRIPPIQEKPAGLSLDDWAEQFTGKKWPSQSATDNWLLFRSRQLDDNDRVWVDKIERRGNEFIVSMHEAIWRGEYFKTFTYYEVMAVNLGPLPPGSYTVKWVVTPLTFTQLEKPALPNRDTKENWPLNAEAAAGRKPVTLSVAFDVE